MKKSILVVLLAVVAYSFAFASDNLDDAKGSAKAVISATSTNVYNLMYTSTKAGWVRVVIKNEEGVVVMEDEIMNRRGFVRPYNFTGMPAGEYHVQVTDATGKTELSVAYTNVAESKVRKAEIKSLEGNKYELRLIGNAAKEVQITIYDATENAVFTETLTQKGSLSRVYNFGKAYVQGGSFEIKADGKVINRVSL